MKAWALALVALVVMVGCSQPYEPSAAERYVTESEALDRLESDMKPLKELKQRVDRGEASPESVELWKNRKDDLEELEAIKERQLERVRAARRRLHD